MSFKVWYEELGKREWLRGESLAEAAWNAALEEALEELDGLKARYSRVQGRQHAIIRAAEKLMALKTT